MFTKTLGVLANLLAPKPRSRTKTVRLGLTAFEDRWVPAQHVTSFQVEVAPDTLLTSGAHDVLGLQVNVQGTHPNSDLNRMDVAGVPYNLSKIIKSASLYTRDDFGLLHFLDSSVPRNGVVRFSHFPRQPVGDHNGTRFLVYLNAIDAPFAPVEARLGIVGANVRRAGIKAFGAGSGFNTGGGGLSINPIYGGPVPAHTTYYVRTMSQAERTLTAGDRGKVIMEFWDVSSDPNAFFRCIRVRTKDGSAMPYGCNFVLQRVLASGEIESEMTIKYADAYGRLPFTIALLGKRVYTGGQGAHLRVVMDAAPGLVGSVVVPEIDVYFSTHHRAGKKIYTSFNGYIPQPPSGSTEIGISAEFQHVQAAGDNLELADLYMYNLSPERLVYLDLTFTGTAPVDLDLKRVDDQGNETGPNVGTFTVVGDHLYITLSVDFNGTLVLDLDGDTFGQFQFTNVHGYLAA